MIHKKFGNHAHAISVLLDNEKNLDRALDYAERYPSPEVWSRLARAQLIAKLIKQAIDSYIKADDPTNYVEVANIAGREGKYEELVRYMIMARKKLREPFIESELLFAYAKTNRLNELEEFVRAPTIAQVQVVGDRCFEHKLYAAAKILFTSVSNYARLATTLVHLNEYQAAVECARKANSTRVWKEVSVACLDQNEPRLAQVCGLNLVVHAEELEDLLRLYEYRGLFIEMTQLLEAGLGLDRAHMGMFTELAILYSKYKPEKLMEHLKIYWSKMNMAKVIRVVEDAHQWAELVFLYIHDDEFDAAISTMMKHSAVAWDHDHFKNVVMKVSNSEIYFKALRFYLDEHPLLLNDLLTVLTPKIDHARVVQMFQKCGHLPMIKDYLVSAQQSNHPAINLALNELLIEEEDFKALRSSIEHYDNFDNIVLATKLESHTLLEFRRIAALLFKKNKKWRQSLALCKQDNMFKDAMETAADSRDAETAEELLRYFVETGDKENFITCLYICYDLLRPDVVIELSWGCGLENVIMPYMCQVMKEFMTKVETLEKDNASRAAREEQQERLSYGKESTLSFFSRPSLSPFHCQLAHLFLL